MTSMRGIGAGKARATFYRLLSDAAAGEVITITKRGRPVAKLVPIGGSDDIESQLEAVRSFRKGNKLGGASIRELIDEGRH